MALHSELIGCFICGPIVRQADISICHSAITWLKSLGALWCVYTQDVYLRGLHSHHDQTACQTNDEVNLCGVNICAVMSVHWLRWWCWITGWWRINFKPGSFRSREPGTVRKCWNSWLSYTNSPYKWKRNTFWLFMVYNRHDQETSRWASKLMRTGNGCSVTCAAVWLLQPTSLSWG